MKTTLSSVVCCCLLLVLITCGSFGEARPHSDRRRHRREYKKLFVFGDSFVDAGNLPPGSGKDYKSRVWYYPYGSHDSAHGNRATGRFSDGLVQSDFLAQMILDLDESPSPYRLWNSKDDGADQFEDGVNFAVGGSSVLPQGSSSLASLRQQISQFRRLVHAGDVDESDLEESVALVAVSGIYDYAAVNVTTTDTEIRSLAEDVTDEIVESVRRLGVSKVLVNSLPPIGCQPWNALTDDGRYSRCDSQGDMISQTHNRLLKQKLSSKHDDVLLLDLFAVFNNLISEDQNNLAPCCDTPGNPGAGYCGQEDAWGRAVYAVCSNPATFFYWDYEHPTQAAWKAVMQALEEPIKEFLY